MKYKVLLVVLTVLVLTVSLRSLLHPQLFPMHDFVHGARIAEMHRAISDGHMPARWSTNFGFGYGMPLFLFYAPLPYYIGAFFYAVGLSLVSSVQMLFILATIATFLGAFTLGYRIAGLWPGFLAATLYTLAPYRAVNIFVRGALSEIWGMAFVVWILVGWLMLVKQHRLGWLVLAVSTAGLFLSHNLTALLFLPFFVVIAISHWLVTSRNYNLLFRTFASLTLGLGLAAFYVLPAMTESKYTQLKDLIMTGYFDFRLHFLYLRQLVTENWGYGGSQWGPEDGMSFFLGFGLLTAVAIGTTCLALFVYRQRRLSRLTWTWLGLSLLTLIAILLTTEKMQLFWENAPLISYLQFPWRFLVLINVLIILLVLVSWRMMPQRFVRLSAVVVILLTLITSWKYFQPLEYYDDSSALYYADADKIAREMSGVLPDYIPKRFSLIDQPPSDAVVVPSQSTDWELLVNRAHQWLISTNFQDDQLVVFAISDFPGWQVEIDGLPIEHQTTSEGLIGVVVPKNAALVGARFTNTPVRTLADVITLVSLLVFFSILFSQSRTKNV